MVSARATASKRLLLALRDSGTRADVSVALGPVREHRWESATFSGHRHEVAGSAPASPFLDRWLDSLHDCDLPMRGQIAADVFVSARTSLSGVASFTIEALTIAE